MKRSPVVAFVGWLCVVACPLAPAQGTFTLKTEQIKDADDPLASMARHWLDPLYSKPAGLKSGPAGITGRPTYFAIKLGDRDVHVAIESGRTPRLYADTNMNGDLSDEKPAPLLQAGRRSWFGFSRPDRFGPVVITIRGGSDPARISLLMETFGHNDLCVCPGEYRAGTVRVAGKSYRIALVDSTLDGRYDRTVQLPYSRVADTLAIDRDGDGRFDARDYTAAEVQPLPKLVAVGEEYYAFRPAADGSTIRIEKAATAMGTLDVGSAGVELMLMSENGTMRLAPKQATCQLPVGRYSCWWLRLTRKDAKGTEWTIQSTGEVGKLKDFEIREGRVTAFRPASPLRVRTEARPAISFFGRRVSIGLSITDDANVEYSAAVQKGGVRASAPSLKVLDESGKVLASGKFEFG